MDTLIDQLITDIQNEFSNNNDYPNVLVKEKYELYPKIRYPAITVEEIENEDNARYFDETERVSNLGYQFNIYTEQSNDKTAIQNVREIAKRMHYTERRVNQVHGNALQRIRKIS